MSVFMARFSRSTRFVVLSFVALTLAACVTTTTPVSQNAGPKIDPTKPVTVALLVPLGSGDPNLDRLSNDLVKAAKMAISDFGDVKINLQVRPTAGNANQAAQAAQNAVASGAKIIIGPLFAEAANAAGNAVAAAGVNVLSFSNNPQIAGGNVFILGETFDDKANRIVRYAASKGYRSISVVAPDNAAGELAANAVRQAASGARVRFDGVQSYEFTPDGIVQAVPRIVSSVKSAGSSAVLLTANSDAGLPIFGQMMPAAGLSPSSVKYLGVTRWDIPRSNLSQPGLNGGWFTLPDVTAVQQFNVRFNNATGAAPHPLSGLAYDGISAVAKLMKSGNANALTKSGLTRRGGFFGTSGVFRFNSDGTNERAQAVAEATGGTFRVISGAPQSFGGAGS